MLILQGVVLTDLMDKVLEIYLKQNCEIIRSNSVQIGSSMT